MSTIRLFYVKLDDGGYLHLREAHNYHAYYFTNRDIAHYAGEGFAKAVRDDYGFDISYSVEESVLEIKQAVALLNMNLEAGGAYDA